MEKRALPIVPSRDLLCKESSKREDSSAESARHPFVSALSMSGGYGQNSYAHNSRLQILPLVDWQRRGVAKARPVILESVKDMFGGWSDFPCCIRIADLGCASGPNAFLVLSDIINAILEISQQSEKLEFEVFLNDLPENDFNTTFKLVSDFQEKLKSNMFEKNRNFCFVSGVAGSFYSRLFPRNSLHFVHSSYSLHWLSRVPYGLENKGNVYMASSTHPRVHKTYLDQFQKDFSLFLRLRSEEIVTGGRLVLTLVGRNTPDPSRIECCHVWVLLSNSLLDLVSQGLVSEADVDSFNMPYYDPYEGELREIIQKEGSFQINKMEAFQYDLGSSNDENHTSDGTETGQNEANCIRAITEPMLASHFGEGIIDNLFARYSEHVGEHASCRYETTVNIVVSLSKK